METSEKDRLDFEEQVFLDFFLKSIFTISIIFGLINAVYNCLYS